MAGELISSNPISIPRTKERFFYLGFQTCAPNFKICFLPTTPISEASVIYFFLEKNLSSLIEHSNLVNKDVDSRGGRVSLPAAFEKLPREPEASLRPQGKPGNEFGLSLELNEEGKGECKGVKTSLRALVAPLKPRLLHKASIVDRKLG
jgi:hypothetical protein